MGSAEKFCQSMYHWCMEMGMRYGQGNPQFPLPRYDFTYGGSTDCSAMVAHCAQEAGWNVPSTIWTGNTAQAFEALGWTRSYYDGLPQKRGAILLNTQNHVGVWDGVHVIEWGGDPRHGYVPYHGFYDYPWDMYLYPPDDDQGSGESEASGEGVVYEVHTEDGWLGAVDKASDGEDGYAGWRMKPIDGIRAYRRDSQPLKISAIMDNGTEWTPTTFTGSMYGVNIDGDGYAGDIDSGHYIIGLRVYGAKCRVKAWNGGWLGWTEGENPTPEGDDFAGEDLAKRVPITAVQMMV